MYPYRKRLLIRSVVGSNPTGPMFIGGKIDLGILTLIQLAIVFGKPISYFIPNMIFLVSLSDLHNKWEEEALSLFRGLEYEGDPELVLRFLKILLDYDIKMQDREWGIPEDIE